jgi:hypothetical protein
MAASGAPGVIHLMSEFGAFERKGLLGVAQIRFMVFFELD